MDGDGLVDYGELHRLIETFDPTNGGSSTNDPSTNDPTVDPNHGGHPVDPEHAKEAWEYAWESCTTTGEPLTPQQA